MTNRLVCLDVVRGLAALSVLFTHVANPLPTGTPGSEFINAYHSLFQTLAWSNKGVHPGVIVFIVLSGFCIHMPAARHPGITLQPNYWSNYFQRRFLRIYPVMLLAMILGVGAYLLTTPGVEPVAVATNFGLNAVLLTGCLPLGAPHGNEILLTVIVECLLYAIYPGVLYLMRTRGGVAWLTMVVTAIYVANAASLLLIRDPVYVQRNVWCFMLFWSAGAISAEMYYRWNWRRLLRWWTVLLLYVAYVLAGRFLTVKGAHYLLSPLLMLVTCVTLCWIIQVEENGGFRSSLAKLQHWIGERSYSLYVVHWPLLVVVDWASIETPYLDLLTRLAGSIVAAIAFYWSVECRFHRMAQARRTPRTSALPAPSCASRSTTSA